MVRDSRIKEFIFSDVTRNATGTNSSTYSDQVNGELLDVMFKTDSTGSIYLQLSGLGTELFRRNAPSGTGWQTAYPRYFGESNTGSIANAHQFGYELFDNVMLGVSGANSGTLPVSVMFHYR